MQEAALGPVAVECNETALTDADSGQAPATGHDYDSMKL
jgi:hypothetical protein